MIMYSPIDLVLVYIKTVTNMAAVKNKPTAIISMNSRIFFPEFSLRPGQSENYNKNYIIRNYFHAK